MKFDTIEFSNSKFVEDQSWMAPMFFQIINSEPKNWRQSDQLKTLDKIERLQMPFTLQISPIRNTKTFLNPLVWRVWKPKKETQCFLHVEGLTNTKPCKLKANVTNGKPMRCNFIMRHQLKESTKLVGKRVQHIKMTLGMHRVKHFALFSILGKGEDKNWSPKLNKKQVRTKVVHAFIFRYNINQHPKQHDKCIELLSSFSLSFVIFVSCSTL